MVQIMAYKGGITRKKLSCLCSGRAYGHPEFPMQQVEQTTYNYCFFSSAFLGCEEKKQRIIKK
jgi:hypothetical protein